MNNSLVQKTLIDIEQNLKEVQSAREQVQSVAISGSKLTQSFLAIIKNLEGIETNFQKERQDFSKTIAGELVKFQNNLESGAKNAISQSSKFHQKHGVEIDKTIDRLSVLQKATDSLKNEISGFDLDLKFSSVSDSLKKLDLEIQGLKSELKTHSSRMEELFDFQMNEQQDLEGRINKELSSIKSSNQYTQIIVIVATLLLGVLILIF